MAPTPIELSLHSLLPTFAALPPDLISLAQSLLSQSKIKAAHLKAEEEVGRTYAVCHIAAERLRSRHGYEVGKARPPVPPRVYGRLKGFLDGVLKDERGTGRRHDAGGAEGGFKKTPETRPTSMRKKWAEARKPKVEVTPSKRPREEEALELSSYVMPMIRHLCRVCDVGKAAPHVFTGVSVVVKEFGRKTEKGTPEPGKGKKRKRDVVVDHEESVVKEDDVPAVVLVLFAEVVRRIFGAEKLVDAKHIEAAKSFATDVRNELPGPASKNEYFDEAAARLGLTATEKARQWTELEWFDNVPAVRSSDPQDDEASDLDSENQEHVTLARTHSGKTPLRRKEKHGKFVDNSDLLGRAGLLPGLGTMFQPAVDWLSDDRVAEFERWKREVRREIVAIEGAG